MPLSIAAFLEKAPQRPRLSLADSDGCARRVSCGRLHNPPFRQLAEPLLKGSAGRNYWPDFRNGLAVQRHDDAPASRTCRTMHENLDFAS
jgi:hypothetical protein